MFGSEIEIENVHTHCHSQAEWWLVKNQSNGGRSWTPTHPGSGPGPSPEADFVLNFN